MRKLIWGALLLFVALNLFSQSSKEDLLKDVVVTVNGKFTCTDFILMLFEDGSTKQIKCYSEAPSVGVISRDYFNQMVVIFQQEMVKNLSGEQQVIIKNIPEIIGNPDMIYNIFMSKTGIQIEIKSDADPVRNTLTWEDIFQ